MKSKCGEEIFVNKSFTPEKLKIDLLLKAPAGEAKESAISLLCKSLDGVNIGLLIDCKSLEDSEFD